MNVTNKDGEKVSISLPERYRIYFERAATDNGYEYDNSIDALVRFAEGYFELNDGKRELFQDIIFCGLVNPLSIIDLAILTQSINEYAVLKGISQPAELAEFYSYLAKRFDPRSSTAKMTEDMYEKIGKEIIRSEKGRFYKGNYYFKVI